jgi:transposase
MAKMNLSRISSFVLDFEKSIFWMGIDVHKKSYSIALRRADAETLTWTSPASSTLIVDQIKQWGIHVGAVAYEAGPTGFSLARTLRAAGVNVIVAAPSRIPRPVTAGAKCDRLDCIKLSEYAAKGMLKAIAVPSVEDEARRVLLRRRHKVVDAVRRCKQRIKSQLLYLGIKEPKEISRWSNASAFALSKLSMHPCARSALESLLRELAFFQEELRQLETELMSAVKDRVNRTTMSCLKSVPGVGSVVAASFALELFRPERFDHADQVSSYLGLAPMIRQSGQSRSSGRLVPVGQSRLRSLLIEAAWSWKSKDAYAASLYKRFVGRMGIAQKAICAVARKLAIILWRLMVEQRAYKPKPALMQ